MSDQPKSPGSGAGVQVLGVVIAIVVAGGVRLGCSELRKRQEEASIAEAKAKVESGELISELVAKNDTPRKFWRASSDRVSVLKGFRKTTAASMSGYIAKIQVGEVTEQRFDYADRAQASLAGDLKVDVNESLAVKGFVEAYMTDASMVYVIAVCDKESADKSDTKVRDDAIDDAHKQIAANIDQNPSDYLKLAGWERVPNESPTEQAAVYVNTEASMNMVVVTRMPAADWRREVLAAAKDPAIKAAVNEGIDEAVQKAQ